MKVLDVNGFQEIIDRLKTDIQEKDQQMIQIVDSIQAFLALKSSDFRGQGAEAITSYYNNIHVTFNLMWEVMTDQLIDLLDRMNSELRDVESAGNGFMRESFINGDLDQGLENVRNITSQLTGEANSIISSVSDIVSIPSIRDSEVHNGVREAHRNKDNAIERLHIFDQTQSNALTVIEDRLRTMKTFLNDAQSQFKNGRFPDAKITDSLRNQIDDPELEKYTLLTTLAMMFRSTKSTISNILGAFGDIDKYSMFISHLYVSLSPYYGKIKQLVSRGDLDFSKLNREQLRQINNMLSLTLFRVDGKKLLEYFKANKLGSFKKENLKTFFEYLEKYPVGRGRDFLRKEFIKLTKIDEHLKFLKMNRLEKVKKFATNFGDELFLNNYRKTKEVIGPIQNWKKPKDALKGSTKKIKENLKEFNGLGKSQKVLTSVSKGLGVLSLGVIVADNVQKGKSNQEIAVGIAVDTTVTAGAAAVGASVGSFFAPPLGTVIGAGVGMGVSYVMNHKFGEPPKSITDHAKDAANKAVNKIKDVGKGIADGIKNLGKGLAGIFG